MNSLRFLSVFYILVGYSAQGSDQPNMIVNGKCRLKNYGHSSHVCICSKDHCGALYRPSFPTNSTNYSGFSLYTTSQAGLRFHETQGLFSQLKANTGNETNGPDFNKFSLRNGGEIVVNHSQTFQSIRGFGGSMTDSAAMNVASLEEDVRMVLMKLMFSEEGNNYNLIRVPVGGTDDSTRTYTYADTPDDFNLDHFALAGEDLEYKIPALRQAYEVAGNNLSLIASAWTAPPWMKNNNKYVNGVLKDEHYQLWADYHIRFFDEYAKHNLTFWAMTTGNEPINGYAIYFVRFNSMGWTPWSQRNWLGRHMGPTLRGSLHNQTLILAHDDQRFLLPWWMDVVMRDELAAKYVDGIAVHWYWDIVDPAIGLDATHNHFPQKFILSSEASNADKPWHLQKVRLGSWSRAVKYMDDIIKDLNHWVTGWMEWSMVLDTAGGPSWSGNYVDVGILVNASSQEILLQPAYFALGHFSRFVVPGSKRVSLTGSPSGLDYIAFVTPNDDIVMVLHNREREDSFVSVRHPGIGRAVLLLPAYSFNTLVYSTRRDF